MRGPGPRALLQTPLAGCVSLERGGCAEACEESVMGTPQATC